MAGQVNITKGNTFRQPPANMLGIGYDASGNLVKINENGTTTILIQQAAQVVSNVIANKGVGLLADLPIVYVQGDVYVTTDTHEVYTAESTDTWGSVALINTQLVTDTTASVWVAYQYDGTSLNNIGEDVGPQAWLDFTPQNPNPAYTRGRLWYDADKECISYYNEEQDVTVNLGQELLIPVYNNTGSTITNGKLVYPTGVDASSGRHTIALADNRYKDKSRLIAMVTHDIENNSSGYVTRLGSVGGLNTDGLSGVVFLGINGNYTETPPVNGAYKIPIGAVKVAHATNGQITMDPYITDLTVEVTNCNGFPKAQKAITSLTFTDGTRTFEIAPTSGSYYFYQFGDKFEKSSSDSVVITDHTGLHVIYFDGGVLTTLFNPSITQIEDIIINRTIVGIVYWNATSAKSIIVGDERHGESMSPYTHLYLHRTRGAQYLEGLAADNYTLVGNGSLNAHAQFGVLEGKITDEDNEIALISIISTTGLRYLYKSGASGDWVNGTNSGFSFPVGGTPLPQYNEWTGTIWQLTEVTSGNYMCIHIFATNDTNWLPLSFIGTEEYANLAVAQAGANDEIAALLVGMPSPEFVPLFTFIIEGKTSFTNSVNARMVALLDWRVTELAQGAAPANHNNLGGLQLAASGNTWGHVDDQAQTIAGEKTFTDNLQCEGQAHGGSYTKTFTASATFDADDGNNQRMVCTGDTALALSNEQPGVFIITLPISGSGVSSISIGASLGTPYPNNDTLAYTDGSINTITVLVDDNGDKSYTITAYAA